MRRPVRLVPFVFVIILAAATAHGQPVPGTISGLVFNDLNGNGAQNPGEPGLAGVTVQADLGADGTVDATQLTDVNGNYTFTLAPGTYRIRQVVPAGRVQTTTNPPDVTLAPAGIVTGVNFGSQLIPPPIPALSTWLLAMLALTLGVIALKR